MMSALLDQMQLTAFDGGTVTLEANAGQNYAVKALDKEDKRREIAEAIAAVTGARVKVAVGKSASARQTPPRARPAPPPPATPPEEGPPPVEEPPPDQLPDLPPEPPPRRNPRKEALNEPIIQETLKLFEGQILNVEIKNAKGDR